MSKPCNCITKVNKLLEERNTVLDSTLILKRGATSRVAVRTSIRTPKRGARPCTMIASFCPFCGVKYKEAT